MNYQQLASSGSNVQIVKTDYKPNGETLQLVRPMSSTFKSTDEIVGELVNKFEYKTKENKTTDNELNTVQQAFGTDLANELINTYEGSNLVYDSRQDLVGEKYLAEQIKIIQEEQKTSSILDKWKHLLYDGEKEPIDFKIPAYEQNQYHTIDTLSTISNNNYFTEQTKQSQYVSSEPSRLQFKSQQQTDYDELTRKEQERKRVELEARDASEREAKALAEAQYKAKLDAQLRAQKVQESIAQAEAQVQEQTDKYLEHLSKLKKSSSQNAEQPKPYLPQLSSSNLNNVTMDAYNNPEFKAMLHHLLKPINVESEQVNYPPDWPTQDKINLLAEPIYIPAPQPIVIPAPNIITIKCDPYNSGSYYGTDFYSSTMKPTVTYYPSVKTDQKHLNDFGVRQLNLDSYLGKK